MVTKGRKKGTVRFGCTPPKRAKRVQLAGDFNGWKPVAMRKQKDGSYAAVVAIPPATYEYKFVVDGTWVPDTDNCNSVINPFGTINSVAIVE